jgi:hypothetical protein
MTIKKTFIFYSEIQNTEVHLTKPVYRTQQNKFTYEKNKSDISEFSSNRYFQSRKNK